MLKSRLLHKVKTVALVYAMLAGGSMFWFGGCTLNDIRDSLTKGALGAVQGAAQNWIGSSIVDLREVFDPIWDNPIPTP